jgi:copper chaperone
MNQSSYTVNGMTCGHCASSVTKEVGKLAGVHKVDVDLPGHRIVVTSESPLPVELVTHAVTGAGFEFVV